jgi:nitrogen fixation-related uncharacterized protein
MRSTSLETELGAVRRRRGHVAALLAALAVTIGVVALLGVAYAQQSEQVEALEEENDRILADHESIGAKFSEQTKRFQSQAARLEDAIRSSYGQGFAAGRRASSLPRPLRSLAGHAAAGMLVPARLPAGVQPDRPRVVSSPGGYTVRWRGLMLFASRVDPLSVWTRQAIAGMRQVRIGAQRVTRVVGPNGVVHAWRANDVTYAVLALPRLERVGRSLVAAMR